MTHTEQFTVLPSGLTIVEWCPVPPPVTVPIEFHRCGWCGKESTMPSRQPLIGWIAPKGWNAIWPDCGHGKNLICMECRLRLLAAKSYSTCPECNCESEYT